MLNCPFCGYDYADQGLSRGQCRNCGGMVNWVDPELEQADPPPQRVAVVEEPPAQPTPAPPPHPSDTSRPLSLDLRQTLSEGDLPKPATTSQETPEDTRVRVTNAWKPVCDTAASPMVTLKASSPESSVTSGLVIQERTLRLPQEAWVDNADYELLDIIGEGGVGVVYAARQASIDRQVAIKMLRDHETSDEQTGTFLAEAVVTGDLDHPNIVPIHDLARSRSGALFYAMKRVQGTPWNVALAGHSLTENLEILMKVADAVAFAHARGIVHRDLKPENVMLGDFGEVLLMDWGIAIPTPKFSKTDQFHQVGAMGGTPAYMAPEMAVGPFERMGTHSDVYLLGAILFEIVTGYPPHTGKNVMDCVLAAARNEIRATDKSSELLEIARRSMATEPRDRYADVLSFQAAIRAYQSHSESVLLSNRADAELEHARRTNDYEAHARALFAYQESLTLWDGNDKARAGISIARAEYAAAALAKGDYDLGLSVLDRDDRSHQKLWAQLEEAQRDRDARQTRLKRVKQLVALLILILFAGGTIAIIKINQSWREADDARQKADVAKGEAMSALSELEVAMVEVTDANKRTLAQSELAEVARLQAEAERDRADAEKRRAERLYQIAEEESYSSEIGLIGERLATDAFGDARSILDRQQSSQRAKLRHWEWGRFHYLCYGLSRRLNDAKPVPTELELEVQSLAVSADETQVLLASPDGHVRLVELASGRLLREWAHGDRVTAVALTTHGRYAATAGSGERSGVVKIWDLNQPVEGALSRTLGPHGNMVLDVSFALSDDKLHVLTCADDKTIKLWDGNTGDNLRTFAGHLDKIWMARVSPRGDRMVSASEDGTARVWLLDNGVEVQRFRGHTGPVYSVAFSPDGRSVVSGGYDQRILVWEAVTDRVDRSALLDEVKLAIAGESIPAAQFRILEGHTAAVSSVSYSKDGHLLLSTGRDNTVCVWDAEPAAQFDEASVVARLRGRAWQNRRDSQPLLTLRGHGGWVTGGSILRNGTTVVSGSLDRSVRTWDLNRYEEERLFQGLDQPILAAAMSLDQRYIVTGLEDGTAKLWDVATASQIASLEEGHEFLTTTAALFPDGKQLLTSAGDGTTRVWDFQRGTQQRVLPETGRRGLAVLSDDGQMILTGSPQKSVKVWQAATGQLQYTLDPHRELIGDLMARNPSLTANEARKRVADITAIALSPDGDLAYIGDASGRASLWETSTGTFVRSLRGHSQAIHAVAFLPESLDPASSGNTLVTAGADGAVLQWAVASGEYSRDRQLRHEYPVTAMIVSADGRQCITASTVRQNVAGLWLWDLASAKLLRQREIPNRNIHSLSLARHTDQVLVTLASSTRDEVWFWDYRDDRFEQYRNDRAQRGTVWTALSTPSGEQLVTVGGKGARLWSLASQQPQTSFRPQAAITSVAFAPDGQTVALASRDGTAKIWSLETHQAVSNLSGAHTGPLHRIVYSPSGDELLTAGEDGRVGRWDPVAGQARPDIDPLDHGAAIRGLAYSPDGRWIVTSGADRVAKIWDASTNTLVKQLVGHQGTVLAVAFSPDGKWIVTGSDDTMVRIWDAAHGVSVAVLEGHPAPITSVGFSPDRLRVLTASQDNTAKLWDTSFLATLDEIPAELIVGKELLSLKRHTQELTHAEFSANGMNIVTASRDGTAALWLGAELAPAIRLQGGSLDYRLGSGPARPHRQAILSQPNTVNYTKFQLIVSVLPNDSPHDRLGIATETNGHGRLTLHGDEILFTDTHETSVTVGKFAGGTGGASRLVVTFTAAATHASVEAILRGITYESLSPQLEATGRAIRVQLLEASGKSGNPEPEVTNVQFITSS